MLIVWRLVCNFLYVSLCLHCIKSLLSLKHDLSISVHLRNFFLWRAVLMLSYTPLRAAAALRWYLESSIDARCRPALCELKFECILIRDGQTLYLHIHKKKNTESPVWFFPLNVNTPLNRFDEFDMRKMYKSDLIWNVARCHFAYLYWCYEHFLLTNHCRDLALFSKIVHS